MGSSSIPNHPAEKGRNANNPINSIGQVLCVGMGDYESFDPPIKANNFDTYGMFRRQYRRQFY